MKRVLLMFISFVALTTTAQEKTAKTPDKNKKVLTVDAACGQCQFAMAGKSCDLAVRINGLAYFVDGSHIDSHGDAHADNGFCNTIRKAQVQGEIVDKRFKASYFQLLPDTVRTEKEILLHKHIPYKKEQVSVETETCLNVQHEKPS